MKSASDVKERARDAADSTSALKLIPGLRIRFPLSTLRLSMLPE